MYRYVSEAAGEQQIWKSQRTRARCVYIHTHLYIYKYINLHISCTHTHREREREREREKHVGEAAGELLTWQRARARCRFEHFDAVCLKKIKKRVTPL